MRDKTLHVIWYNRQGAEVERARVRGSAEALAMSLVDTARGRGVEGHVFRSEGDMLRTDGPIFAYVRLERIDYLGADPARAELACHFATRL